MVEASSTNMSVIWASLIGIDLTVDVKPKIRKILNIFEPTMLPMAISVFFLSAAVMFVAISGSEVPMATSVNPINASLTLIARAINMAFSNAKLLPTAKAARPPRT